jgi:hypothetical protein
MSSSADVSINNPKDCVYGCNTRIYWNNLTSEYWEVLTKKKHICTNRSNNNNKKSATATANINNIIPPKSKYYNSNYGNRKSWTPKFTNKQPMDNSLEILQGSADTIRKQYEVLADLIKEYNGKTHGSQSHIDANNFIHLIVYYEVPEGMREEIKRTFDNFTQRTEVKAFRNQ